MRFSTCIRSLLLLISCFLSIGRVSFAQLRVGTVSPPQLSFQDDFAKIPSLCEGDAVTRRVCINFREAPIDVVFLVDGTGTFEARLLNPNDLGGIIPEVVDRLQNEPLLAGRDIGFGVARFEDYGGSNNRFTFGTEADRPYILNQPIVTEEIAAANGTSVTELVSAALSRGSIGDGGDAPEAAITESLWQLMSGVGFDSDLDGTSLGKDGTQVAGNLLTQVAPDESGDIPPFSSLEASVLRAGNLGGIGFRPNSKKIIILVTNWCSIAPFSPLTGIPATLTGKDGVTVPTSDLACYGERLGRATLDLRLGLLGEVAPLNGVVVPDVLERLIAEDIQVVGFVPDGKALPIGSGVYAPRVGGFPAVIPGVGSIAFLKFYQSLFASTLAHLSGARDQDGRALVFNAGDPSPVDGSLPSAPNVDGLIAGTSSLLERNRILANDRILNSLTLRVESEILNLPITINQAETSNPLDRCYNVTFADNNFSGAGDTRLIFEGLEKIIGDSQISYGNIPVEVSCNRLSPNLPPPIIFTPTPQPSIPTPIVSNSPVPTLTPTSIPTSTPTPIATVITVKEELPTAVCENRNIFNTLLALDGAAFGLNEEIKFGTSRLARMKSLQGERRSRIASRLRELANLQFLIAWESAWSLPQVVTRCQGVLATNCFKVNYHSERNNYLAASNRLKELALQVVRELRLINSKRSRSIANSISKKIGERMSEVITFMADLPEEGVQCQ